MLVILQISHLSKAMIEAHGTMKNSVVKVIFFWLFCLKECFSLMNHPRTNGFKNNSGSKASATMVTKTSTSSC